MAPINPTSDFPHNDDRPFSKLSYEAFANNVVRAVISWQSDCQIFTESVRGIAALIAQPPSSRVFEVIGEYYQKADKVAVDPSDQANLRILDHYMREYIARMREREIEEHKKKLRVSMAVARVVMTSKLAAELQNEAEKKEEFVGRLRSSQVEPEPEITQFKTGLDVCRINFQKDHPVRALFYTGNKVLCRKNGKEFWIRLNQELVSGLFLGTVLEHTDIERFNKWDVIKVAKNNIFDARPAPQDMPLPPGAVQGA